MRTAKTDWADAQADRARHFVGFVMLRLNYFPTIQFHCFIVLLGYFYVLLCLTSYTRFPKVRTFCQTCYVIVLLYRYKAQLQLPQN